ncbi:hypothetical protein V502_01416 [Pseudogymnoascus sp. VKM F-4520 (FW-2644)]|nr:hypothetical protein V502_01416 [Pseudogymnoascus sp. VKM F-4520 (FW-2644)]
MVNFLQTALLALVASNSAIALPNPITYPVPKPDPIHGTSKYQRRGLTLEGRASRETYANEAVAGIIVLHQWYGDNGLWDNRWWNSANVITMLADFQAFAPDQVSGYTADIYPKTLANAPSWGGFTGFINDYYDDELWWCLAWIQVFDVTKDQKYLDMASSIFEDAKKAWGEPACGGLHWKKGDPAVNAIENELYLSAAAKLANRKPSSPSGGYYFNEAIKAYEWFFKSGMINNEFLINDGLTADCKNNGAATWSYNQGVILGGLTELSWSSGDAKYTTLAVNIAKAAITKLTNADGILTDACGTCGGDGGQFKGVFVRNVQFMYNRANGLMDATKAQFKAFLQLNADTVWEKDQEGNYLGPVWAGPYIRADVNSQSSALDLLVAAAGVS